jgi:hypothetical protein
MLNISDMVEAMRPLLNLARSVLWHWKTFPIILPYPITAHTEVSGGSQMVKVTF